MLRDARPRRRRRTEARGARRPGPARGRPRRRRRRDGDDALWMAEAAPYDAIVLDVMLPGIDGFEILRRLRARQRVDAGADADRARRDRGPGRRARRGRRRLPDQAVLVRRAARPPARARAPRPDRTADDARGRRPAARPGRPARVARRPGARPDGTRVRAARALHATARATCSPGCSCSKAPGTWRSRASSNVVDVYIRYLREKIDRPFGRELARDGSRRRLPPPRRRRAPR